MVLGLKVEYLRLAKEAERLVVLLAAGEKVLVGKIGQSEHYRRELRLNFLESLVDSFGLRAKLLHSCKDLVYVLTLFLVLRDQLVGSVLLCLDVLGLANEISALCVKRKYLRDLFLRVLALLLKSCYYLFGIFFDVFDV